MPVVTVRQGVFPAGVAGGRPGKPVDEKATIVTSAPVDAKEAPYVTREAVLKLLSDEEIARVSTDEGSGRLSASDEYLDLVPLYQGVKRGPSPGTPMGGVLSRKAIRSESWDKVTARWAPSRRPGPDPRC